MYSSFDEEQERRPLLRSSSLMKEVDGGQSSSSNSSSSSSRTNRAKSWTIFVSVIAILCATGLVAVSFNWVQVAQDTSAVSMKRIELTKQGKLAYEKLSDTEVSTLFEEFKTKFDRTYATEKEEKSRFKNFLEFLRNVDSRNEKEQAEGGSAIHGVTVFSDMSTDEISNTFMGYVPVSTPEVLALSKKPMLSKYKGKDNTVDWTGIYTTEIKQQGYCGSCWAFAAVMQIESDGIRNGLITMDDSLSTQQLVACDNEDNSALSQYVLNRGCLGGNTETAYAYVNYVGGVVHEADYPYTSFWEKVKTCEKSNNEYVVTVDNYYVIDTGEDDMIEYVMSTGPLAVCVDANEWVSYTGGVIHSCGNDLDHCVQLVGYNKDDEYWIVRNSWGEAWGANGFVYLKGGKNTCGLTTIPTYTKVSMSSSSKSKKSKTTDEDADADEDEDEDEDKKKTSSSSDSKKKTSSTDSDSKSKTSDADADAKTSKKEKATKMKGGLAGSKVEVVKGGGALPSAVGESAVAMKSTNKDSKAEKTASKKESKKEAKAEEKAEEKAESKKYVKKASKKESKKATGKDRTLNEI